MLLRILIRTTEITRSVNLGSNRYPRIEDEIETTEASILQFRASLDEDWQDVETELEFIALRRD